MKPGFHCFYLFFLPTVLSATVAQQAIPAPWKHLHLTLGQSAPLAGQSHLIDSPFPFFLLVHSLLYILLHNLPHIPLHIPWHIPLHVPLHSLLHVSLLCVIGNNQDIFSKKDTEIAPITVTDIATNIPIFL